MHICSSPCFKSIVCSMNRFTNDILKISALRILGLPALLTPVHTGIPCCPPCHLQRTLLMKSKPCSTATALATSSPPCISTANSLVKSPYCSSPSTQEIKVNVKVNSSAKVKMWVWGFITSSSFLKQEEQKVLLKDGSSIELEQLQEHNDKFNQQIQTKQVSFCHQNKVGQLKPVRPGLIKLMKAASYPSKGHWIPHRCALPLHTDNTLRHPFHQSKVTTLPGSSSSAWIQLYRLLLCCFSG